MLFKRHFKNRVQSINFYATIFELEKMYIIVIQQKPMILLAYYYSSKLKDATFDPKNFIV